MSPGVFMKIGLDITRINASGGLRRIANEILRALCTGFPQHTFYGFGPRPEEPHGYLNFRRVPFPASFGIINRLQYAIAMGHLLRRNRVDVHHNLANPGVYHAPCPTVTTVHDLIARKYPEFSFSRLNRLIHRYYTPHLIRKASRMAAISMCTQSDLRAFLGVHETVSVVYWGSDHGQFNTSPSQDNEVLKVHGLRPGYLLFVGNMMPNKNLYVLIRALKRLAHNRNGSTPLVMAGRPWPGSHRFARLADRLGVRAQMIELGHVPDEHLPALYRQAGLFLFPSRYEGFGLPVVEAMRCGCPVLVANAGSLPELVPKASLRCEPDAEHEWAAKITTLLHDQAARQAARGWGLEQAARFTWRRCADAYMELYNNLLSI